MATKAQAVKALAGLGLKLSQDSGRSGIGYHATIDAIGRNRIDGECRGHVVTDATAMSAEFWSDVINEARTLQISPCGHAIGDCDFHDEAEEHS